jgi:hypothetical protein
MASSGVIFLRLEGVSEGEEIGVLALREEIFFCMGSDFHLKYGHPQGA